ncbi:MAG: ribosomal-processing cysteine protease Prp [Firmicutes bacterium]|nr:ribosomal-processing cysteine protease Prp [Bacillota bacterium]
MIKAEIFRNKNGRIYGFSIKDHGESIVCSAVSVLALNTVNSIERFTDEEFSCIADEENGGILRIEVTSIKNGKDIHDIDLLFNSLLLGLTDIEKEYSKEIKLIDKNKSI